VTPDPARPDCPRPCEVDHAPSIAARVGLPAVERIPPPDPNMTLPATALPELSPTPVGDEPTVRVALETWKPPASPAAVARCRSACLVHIYPTGPQLGSRLTLSLDSVILGRGEDCGIQIRDSSISRYHAVISRNKDGEYSVTDLESKNGTFVNNASPRGGILQHGDYLRFGDCVYRFLADRDIEAEYREELYRIATMDGLTQIHNRRYLDDFLTRELARARHYRRPLAVVLLDLDHFRSVNEGFGRLAGDMALLELSGRLRAAARRDELVARFADDRFAVVLPESDGGPARATAERLLHVVERQPFRFNGLSYPLTASAGVAAVSGGEVMRPDALLARAETNLFRAKQAGRNRVVVS
jgi:two-component system cell cycle response regulator